jgi:hypothetical protein
MITIPANFNPQIPTRGTGDFRNHLISFPELQSCRKVENLNIDDWKYLESAAGFEPRTGKRANYVVSDEVGKLWVIDTCGEAFAVDVHLAKGIAP